MRVLVTYGSKRGGTAGLAEMVADALRAHGHDALVLPAGPVHDLARFDAAVVGGALYSNRWHRDARRFVRRHSGTLRTMPVFFFSSGPLDDSAAHAEIGPTAGVAKLMDRVGACGHMTFGGRLSPDAKGFPASAMARDRAGDWRDRRHVERWAATVDAELSARQPVP